ncbi:MAG: FtsJ-like methyltransferase [Microgenomates group bacterium Gr01-1014_16]|nr:MAG: FtsJ-like methyltransferase [Microgenomates group bacterium Gr01-1014_16]
MHYVSRAGEKLEFALATWHINVTGLICADLGCSAGGFTDCLLQRGAAKVYAVDTGYGVLDWKLRNNSRVIVMERTNALHVKLPELVDFVSIDVGWTPQRLILPVAKTLLKPGGQIISLIKPHYEAKKAHLTPDEAKNIADQFAQLGQLVQSPITGQKAGNVEYLLRMLY